MIGIIILIFLGQPELESNLAPNHSPRGLLVLAQVLDEFELV